jgi:hypothetical protein
MIKINLKNVNLKENASLLKASKEKGKIRRGWNLNEKNNKNPILKYKN